MKRTIIALLALVVFAGGLFAALNRPDRFLRPELRVQDRMVIEPQGLVSKGSDYEGDFEGMNVGSFDKAGLGLRWNNWAQRRVQAYYPEGFGTDPDVKAIIGGVYGKLHGTGLGTIGGVISEWGAGDDFNAFGQAAWEYSPHVGGNPAGRYPNSIGVANGWIFGIFNDYWDDGDGVGAQSEPYMLLGDSNWGWDGSYWIPMWMNSDPDATPVLGEDSETSIPGSWLGFGDAVYNEAEGSYHVPTYWTTGGLPTGWDEYKFAFVTGYTDPNTDVEDLWDEELWNFTDWRDGPYIDGSDRENGFLNTYGDIKLAMAKDERGYGTGYGIAMVIYDDVTYEVHDLEGNPIDYGLHLRPGYIYTTDWGHTWITPGMEGNNFFPADDMYKVFPWYNALDDIGDEEEELVPINWPFIYHDIDVVMDENNRVYVLMEVWPESTETDQYWFPYRDGEVIFGMYVVTGTLHDDGVKWEHASLAGNLMGWLNDDRTGLAWDFARQYVNDGKVSIGHAGKGVVYASWADRPEVGAMANPIDGGFKYNNNAFFTYSHDTATTWAHAERFNALENFEGYDPEEDGHLYVKYAWDITGDARLHEEGWNVASLGRNVGGAEGAGTLTVFGAHQHVDPDSDPISGTDGSTLWHYQQFLRIWKIESTDPTGIEVEHISLTKDFNLYQNYPNPFNPNTEIKFSLMNDSDVRLTVFNIKGETVMNLKNERMAKGVHTVNFDAGSLNSGVYFYQLNVNGRAETKKMVLMK